jgi:hypothetical protein
VHGLVFTAFRAFSVSEYPGFSDRLWDGSRRYLATEAYEDAEFDALVGRAVELSGDPRATVLRRFGIFAGVSTFRFLYPEYYAAHDDTLGFLVNVEDRIHNVVRRTVPGAAPPQLVVERLDETGVRIDYSSARRLCELLDGLVVGVSRYYGDSLRVEQPSCMLRGDAVCTFVVRRD